MGFFILWLSMKNNNHVIQELGRSAIMAINSGDVSGAENKLLRILEIDPTDFNALNLLAYLCAINGNQLRAIHYLEAAIKIKPLDRTVLINLGKAYLETGNYQNSIHVYTIYKNSHPFNPEVILDLAVAYFKTGNYQLALEICTELIEENEKNLAAWKQLSIIYLKLGHFQESKDAAATVLNFDMSDPESWILLGNVEYELGNIDEAINSYIKASDINPCLSLSWTNIGNCYLRLGHYDRAIEFYHHSLSLELSPDSYYNLGVAYGRCGDFISAISTYDKLLKIEPDNARGLLNKGLALLQLGIFDFGWSLYENRFKLEGGLKNRHSDIKRLESLKDVVGKKLLVWHEQGMGDTLQFSRYIKLLEKKGVAVTFEVQTPLHELLKNQFECCVVDEVINTKEFEYQVPLLSLPLIFKTTLDAIPEEINVSPEVSKVQFWKERIKRSPNKMNIGLAVSGNNLHQDDAIRSMPLHLIEPLLDRANIFLLQKEVREADQEFLKNNPVIINLETELVSFSDTAAVVQCLDLIISVDTSLIHLAGVMGKESYLLLPKIAEWRWLMERSDTPWYKNITLIRQNTFGCWNDVIQQLLNALLKYS